MNMRSVLIKRMTSPHEFVEYRPSKGEIVYVDPCLTATNGHLVIGNGIDSVHHLPPLSYSVSDKRWTTSPNYRTIVEIREDDTINIDMSLL